MSNSPFSISHVYTSITTACNSPKQYLSTLLPTSGWCFGSNKQAFAVSNVLAKGAITSCQHWSASFTCNSSIQSCVAPTAAHNFNQHSSGSSPESSPLSGLKRFESSRLSITDWFSDIPDVLGSSADQEHPPHRTLHSRSGWPPQQHSFVVGSETRMSVSTNPQLAGIEME